MSVIQDEVSIRAVPNKYGTQSWLIKDLIAHFESALQDKISNNQKKLVENSNHNQIFQRACANIRFQMLHQSYTEWELPYACIARILLKTAHQVISRNMEFLGCPWKYIYGSSNHYPKVVMFPRYKNELR